jgi:hypothetical protein
MITPSSSVPQSTSSPSVPTQVAGRPLQVGIGSRPGGMYGHWMTKPFGDRGGVACSAPSSAAPLATAVTPRANKAFYRFLPS